MIRNKFNIINLDCANCAREIEEGLSKKYKNVVVNFNTSKLLFDNNKEVSIKEINELVRQIEPDVTITKDEVNINKEFHMLSLVLGVSICLITYFSNITEVYKYILYLISYSLLLYRTFLNMIKMLIKNKSINENGLITISCIGALLIGEVLEGMMVITLYTIGKILEEKAINNSRKSIKNLIDIKQNYANLKINQNTQKIDVEDIKINDILIVKKGERVPVDSIIIKGKSLLDTSALTGESELVEVSKNDKLLSGSINKGDLLEIKATHTFNDSTVSKILDLLENATDKKTKTETSVSKISKIYTPIILLSSIILVVVLPLFEIEIKEAIYRALTFLVISCPCAIAISVPLSYFTGIGIASKYGILIKGSNYLDNLSNCKKIIFDKTGTLTNGSFTVEEIQVINKEYTKEQIIDIITKGESLSNHPIAKSIINLKNGKIDNSKVTSFKEIEGLGITFELEDLKIKIGNSILCNCEINTDIHVSINNKHVASLIINDGIKENALETIEKIKKYGIKTFMFTGDKKEVALSIGKKLKIDEIKYNLLPTDKYAEFEKINDELTIFIGDGINDAPVLKRADIGISMGSIGSESAIEASDIVLIKDELNKIPLAIDISYKTKKIIKQNLIFACSIKLAILILSLFGLTNMWFAVFADTGVTLLTIINTLRILKVKEK